jgi:succinyl-diaminopimelate desuccinylase
VVLLFVADEETGNAYGVEHVLRAAPTLVRPDDWVLVPDFGTADGLSIEVAEKTTLWVRLQVLGRQVHASMPHDGVNAHRAAAHLVVQLDEALPARFCLSNPLFLPERSTFEPTKREANVSNVNTIPGEENVYFDCRLLPEHDPEEVKQVFRQTAGGIETLFGVKVQVSFPLELSAAPPTPPDAPVVKALTRALRGVRGDEAALIGIGGGTVAGAFRRRGVPAAVWSTMDDTAHQPDEYSVLANLIEDAKVLTHLFVQGR